MDPGNDQQAALRYDLKHLTSLSSFPKYRVKVVYYILDRDIPGFLSKVNLVFSLRPYKDLSPKRRYIILAGTTLKLI